MKYRKKPVVIEAFQFDGCLKQCYIPEWAFKAVEEDVIYVDNGVVKIATLEGDHTVSFGDYIIQGVQGELYPCKPDIFEKRYELAE